VSIVTVISISAIVNKNLRLHSALMSDDYIV